MSEIVFILGAGASKHAGIPLMVEFLDKARALFAAGDVGAHGEDFKNVFSALSRLQIVHSKCDLDLVNLESVFGVFEMQKLLGMDADAATNATSIQRVIAHTIHRSMAIQLHPATLVLPTSGYDRLAKLILDLKNRGISAALITFNYDVTLDFALASNGVAANYYLSDGDGDRIPLLKLHGSLNWARCRACEEILTTQFHLGPNSVNQFQTAIDAATIEHRHNSDADRADQSEWPIIVPPGWDKASYHSALSRVWKQAATELSEASSIFVCGYSLPETDLFFKYLYALGSVGETLLQRFWVCDPTPSVHQRFQSLLGPGARARFKSLVHYFETTGLDQIVQTMR